MLSSTATDIVRTCMFLSPDSEFAQFSDRFDISKADGIRSRSPRSFRSKTVVNMGH